MLIHLPTLTDDTYGYTKQIIKDVFSTENKYKDDNKRIAFIRAALIAINRPLTHPQRTKKLANALFPFGTSYSNIKIHVF